MLDKKYNHLAVEKGKYENWKKKGYFTSGDMSKKPYAIVIPPPNVTGKLHIGHAWNTALQDILIRYKKLKGFDTLWVPGMDHAGIATTTPNGTSPVIIKVIKDMVMVVNSIFSIKRKENVVC